MNKVRKECFLESIDDALVSVEMSLNLIDSLYNEKEIEQKYVKNSLEKAFYDLEINLSLLCVIIRKMSESNYTRVPDEIWSDVNTLIHSCKFEYKKGVLRAYSRQNEEIVQLNSIMEFARKIKEENNQSL